LAGKEEKTDTTTASDKALEKKLLAAYDSANGGWGTIHKFMDWDIIEYCMAEILRGNAQWEPMARKTLDAQLGIMDPVWGGVYQYSTDGDWKHPHFEKLLQFQAENLRTYALACGLWNDPHYLQAAQHIRKYVAAFLTSPGGVFYTSQDADL